LGALRRPAEELWDRPASEQAMATSPNGRLLYIVDATLGLVTVMDTASLEIHTAPIDLAVPGVRHTSAVVSANGSALFVGTSGEHSGVTKIDTDTFEVLRTWETDDVSGLGLSADGERLYVAFDDRVESWTQRPAPSWPASRSPAPPRSNA
jgi:DNA-binding beta-propeller fold protein YncE